MKQTQTDKVLELLKAGRTVTPVSALYLCGSFRLSERIRECERKGYRIGRGWHTTNSGAKVRSYWLET